MENEKLIIPFNNPLVGDYIRPWKDSPLYVVDGVKRVFHTEDGLVDSLLNIHEAKDWSYKTTAFSLDCEVVYGPFRPTGWRGDQGIELGDRVRVVEAVEAVRAVTYPVGTEGVVCEIKTDNRGQPGQKMYMVAVPTPFNDGESIWGDPEETDLDRKAIATGYFNDELERIGPTDFSGDGIVKFLGSKIPHPVIVEFAKKVSFNYDYKHPISGAAFRELHDWQVKKLCEWGEIRFEGSDFYIDFDMAKQVFVYEYFTKKS